MILEKVESEQHKIQQNISTPISYSFFLRLSMTHLAKTIHTKLIIILLPKSIIRSFHNCVIYYGKREKVGVSKSVAQNTREKYRITPNNILLPPFVGKIHLSNTIS